MKDPEPLAAATDSHLRTGPTDTDVRSLEEDGPARNPSTVSTVLSAEQLVTATEWVQSGKVRLRRRIVSEIRTVEVEVRHEELVIDTYDVAPGAVGISYRGTALEGPAVPGPATPAPATVILLREEVPEVVMRARVYERVTVDAVTVDETAVWHDTLRHEEAGTNTSPTS